MLRVRFVDDGAGLDLDRSLGMVILTMLFVVLSVTSTMVILGKKLES